MWSSGRIAVSNTAGAGSIPATVAKILNMQYITPAGETGRKVNENIELGKYQLELPSGPGEAPRFEWFKQSELAPADDPPAPVPQEPVEVTDMEAQLQTENALQALEIIDLKARINQNILQIANLKHELKAFTDVYGPKVPAVETTSIDTVNPLISLPDTAAAAAVTAWPTNTPSDNANNPG